MCHYDVFNLLMILLALRQRHKLVRRICPMVRWRKRKGLKRQGEDTASRRPAMKFPVYVNSF